MHGLVTPVVPFRPVRDTIADIDDDTSPMPLVSQSLLAATAGNSGVVECVRDDFDDITARVPDDVRRAAIEEADSLERERTLAICRNGSAPALTELIAERNELSVELVPVSGVMDRTEVLDAAADPVVPAPALPVDHQGSEPIVIPGLEKSGSRWPIVVLSFVTFLSLSFAVYTSIQRPITVAAAPRTPITLAAHSCAVETALRAAPPEPAPAPERVATASTRRPPRLVRPTSGQAIPVRGQPRAGIIRSMPF